MNGNFPNEWLQPTRNDSRWFGMPPSNHEKQTFWKRKRRQDTLDRARQENNFNFSQQQTPAIPNDVVLRMDNETRHNVTQRDAHSTRNNVNRLEPTDNINNRAEELAREEGALCERLLLQLQDSLTRRIRRVTFQEEQLKLKQQSLDKEVNALNRRCNEVDELVATATLRHNEAKDMKEQARRHENEAKNLRMEAERAGAEASIQMAEVQAEMRKLRIAEGALDARELAIAAREMRVRQIHHKRQLTEGQGEPNQQLGSFQTAAQEAPPMAPPMPDHNDQNPSTDSDKSQVLGWPAAPAKHSPAASWQPGVQVKLETVDMADLPGDTYAPIYEPPNEKPVFALALQADMSTSASTRSLYPSSRSSKVQKLSSSVGISNGTNELERTASPRAALNQPSASKQRQSLTPLLDLEAVLRQDAPSLLEALRERQMLEGMCEHGPTFYDKSDDGGADTAMTDGGESFRCDFVELEQLLAKLFGDATKRDLQSQGLFGSTAKQGKAKYCIENLIALLEQTKSVQRKGWPVTWGWCSRLHSFVFVFDRHNRILLERPEYGNATYFFEVEEGVPVLWQVRRLISVLSVSNVGKNDLLENKPLEVAAEKASILQSFGWTPNTGLGSLLNFSDRLYHDYRQHEDAASFQMAIAEWRSKIGKRIMDGFDHGRCIKDAYV